jgi:hypothetical protein
MFERVGAAGYRNRSMSSIATSSIAFACVFGGAVIGMLVRRPLPQHHLSGDSKETVKVGMGLVATMSALVLGLLVSSSKTFYDTQSAELTQMSADVVLLDRLLAHYGPEASEARDVLRATVIGSFNRIWPHEGTRSEVPASREDLLDEIQALSPKDDKQHSLQSQALNLTVTIGRTRWLMYQQLSFSVSKVLIAIMVFWLTVVFFSFGLFAPRNITAIASLFAAALSVSGAILLILEMYTPFAGLVQISNAPLRSALAQLGH